MRNTRFLLLFTSLLSFTSAAFGHGVQIQLTFDATRQQIETRRIMTGSADVVPFGYDRETYLSAPTRAYVAPLTHITSFAQSGAPGYGPLPGNDGWYANFVPLLKPGTPALKYPSGVGVSWQYDTDAIVPATFVGTPAPLAGTGWALNGSQGRPLVNLTGKRFGIRFIAGLKVWDAASGSFVDPGDEQLQGFSSDATTAITPALPKATTSDNTFDDGSGPSFMNSAAIGTTWSNAPHNSWSFRVLGNGIDDSRLPDDGLYLAQYRVITDALTPDGTRTVAPSDVVSLLLTKNVSLEEQAAAIASLGFLSQQVQYAPEPTTALTALVLSVLLGARHRV